MIGLYTGLRFRPRNKLYAGISFKIDSVCFKFFMLRFFVKVFSPEKLPTWDGVVYAFRT